MKNNIKKCLLSLTVAAFLISPISLAHAANSTTGKSCPTTRCNYKTNINLKNCLTKYTCGDNYTQKLDQCKNSKEDKVSTEENNTTKPVEKETNENIQTSANAEELEVVKLVNIERKKAGLSPLTHSDELSKVARVKSQDMADKNYFDHNSPTYKDPFTMMKNFGIKYRQAGENIAKGYSSADSVVKGWMNSPGHRANILNPNFNKIGVGYVNKGGTTYWTQMFTD
ncbi:CAP domain-containing protein [Anaerosalibacter massiliensis]|uniref:CAP domain-containing protein n=1 Tax=Anaerosalibacter massiliensis TaxID=1347392 RepID=A0A9X2S4V0_9FIRM|nr:CAP domain-containing protein [Anaerosalibacter massiliensis]MCR2043873.1 CAP domain-containing protein [Anaerosalibacter massiliensis]